MRAILDGDALATLGKITLLMVFATRYGFADISSSQCRENLVQKKKGIF